MGSMTMPVGRAHLSGFPTLSMKRPSRRKMQATCGEIGPDDGVDPRELAKARMNQHKALRPGPPSGEREPGRKARQLSRQVGETLDSVLAGESGDEILRCLRVVSVVPAPDASRLLVTLRALPPFDTIDPNLVLSKLEKASGWLRTEAASAVTRKRAPMLAFRVISGPESS